MMVSLAHGVAAAVHARGESPVELGLAPLVNGRLLPGPLILGGAAVLAPHASHQPTTGGTDGGTSAGLAGQGSHRRAQQGTTGCATDGTTAGLWSCPRRGWRRHGIESGPVSGQTSALGLVHILLVLTLTLIGEYEKFLGL
jgi:hypothetical protein